MERRRERERREGVTDLFELLQLLQVHAVVPFLVSPHLLHSREAQSATTSIPVNTHTHTPQQTGR